MTTGPESRSAEAVSCATARSAPGEQPASLTATGVDRGVELSWTADDMISAYEVRWRQTAPPDTAWSAWEGTESTSSHALTGLTNSNSCAAQVRATNNSGDGPPPLPCTRDCIRTCLAAAVRGVVRCNRRAFFRERHRHGGALVRNGLRAVLRSLSSPSSPALPYQREGDVSARPQTRAPPMLGFWLGRLCRPAVATTLVRPDGAWKWTIWRSCCRRL